LKLTSVDALARSQPIPRKGFSQTAQSIDEMSGFSATSTDTKTDTKWFEWVAEE
jgi:hypothetical protein